MCLAVPLRIERVIDSHRVVVIQGSTELEIDTTLLESAGVGDYVIVHAGYAIDLLDYDEATERIAMFDEILPQPNDP